MLFKHKERVLPSDGELKLILASWAKQSGPGLHWLIGSPPSRLVELIRAEEGRDDIEPEDRAMLALLCCKVGGSPLQIRDWSLFRRYRLGMELAGMLSTAPLECPDEVIMWALRSTHRTVRDAALEAVDQKVANGHLMLQDGICAARREARLPRVGHRLRRLVVIGSDGMISLAALRWLADQDVAFVMLDRDGSVLATTGPVVRCPAATRASSRAGNGVGLEICRALIDAKLQAQEQLVRERQLNDPAAALCIAGFRDKLAEAGDTGAIRVLEAHAAISYFGTWKNVPVMWPKADLRKIPDHWRMVGSRHPPLSGGHV